MLQHIDRATVHQDRLAKAVVDRITHRAHIIETRSESWRSRQYVGSAIGIRLHASVIAASGQ